MVSRVGGDPFSNMGEAEESMQLPIALWWVLVVTVIIAFVIHGVESMQVVLQCNHQLSAKAIS